MTLIGIGLGSAFVSIMLRNKLKRRHAAELAEADLREHNLRLRVDQQAVSVKELMSSNQRLIRHNQRLMRDLGEARILAMPLTDDAFTLEDRLVLITAGTQLSILMSICESKPILDPATVKRVIHAMKPVLARVSRHLSADGTLLIQPVTDIDRGQYGYWTHPHLPQFSEATSTERLAAWERAQQMEVHMVHDDRDLPYDVDGYDLSTFEPQPPKGDGWFLLSIHDTEDGAAAWYGRRLPAVAEAAA